MTTTPTDLHLNHKILKQILSRTQAAPVLC